MTRMMSDRIVTARDPAEGNRKPGLDTRNHHIPLCRKQLAILAALDDHALGARGSDSAAQGKTQAFPASAREFSWIGLDKKSRRRLAQAEEPRSGTWAKGLIAIYPVGVQ